MIYLGSITALTATTATRDSDVAVEIGDVLCHGIVTIESFANRLSERPVGGRTLGTRHRDIEHRVIIATGDRVIEGADVLHRVRCQIELEFRLENWPPTTTRR
jgi:hypothetical protein